MRISDWSSDVCSSDLGAKTFDAQQDARTETLYGEVRLKLVESLSLIAGGIYADGMRRQREAFNNGPVDTYGRADFDAFSPKLGLLFEPAPGVQFYGNYSRSVEFPGFIELAQLSAFVPLDPQRAWTAEIGTRGRAGVLRWDLSLYRADITGELLQYTVGSETGRGSGRAGGC